jgi:PAS domain-containing protein
MEGEAASLATPEIQAQLLSEAVLSASVGFLVWDDERRYIAANDVACEILRTTRHELLGARVGGHSDGVEQPLLEALRTGFVHGTARVRRFDGSGEIDVVYMTFTTTSAGMPYMGTLIAEISQSSSASSRSAKKMASEKVG